MTLILWLAFGSFTASAQWQKSNWLHLDGAYAQRESRGGTDPTLTSVRVGARGELGLNLMRFLAVSAGGTYQDGGGTVANAAATNFSGYASDTRALAHVIYGPVVLSTGLAQSEAFDNVPGVYRARTSFKYKPMMVTLNWGAAYVRLEHDVDARGSISRTYSDQGGGRRDLQFALPKTRAQSAEVGLFLPSVKFATRVFVHYARTVIDEGSLQSTGVEDVVPQRTEVKAISAGLGLAF